MIFRKILLLIAVVLCLSLSARAQYVDRILRPCFSGVVPYVQVVTTSTGDIALTTCTGGAVTVNGAPIGGGGGTPANPSTSVQFNNGGAFGGQSTLTWTAPTLKIGSNGILTGRLQMNSASASSNVIIAAQDTPSFTSWMLTLPNSAGTSGQFLQTDGAGVTTWAAAGGGGGGITSINTLTAAVQGLTVSNTNGLFGFISSGATHTLFIADATSGDRGFVNAGNQVWTGPKTIRMNGSPAVDIQGLSGNPAENSAIAFSTNGGTQWTIGNSPAGTSNDFFVSAGGANANSRQVWKLGGSINFASAAVTGWTASGDANNGAIDTGLARNAAGVVEVNNGTAGTLRDLTVRGVTAVTVKATSTLQTGVFTVATLPTCNGAAEGTHAGVNDALAPAFLVAVAGGGTVHTSVYCNGTTWVAN